MIEDRPVCVDARQEVGHYEGDTVQGASWEKPCVVTVVERVTGLLLVGKSPDKTVRSRRLERIVRCLAAMCKCQAKSHGRKDVPE